MGNNPNQPREPQHAQPGRQDEDERRRQEQERADRDQERIDRDKQRDQERP